ncbi:purine-nucleoside phosphorylase [Brevibacillus fluminis]|uniref:Purine nucleoside phosphorylase n=1 Tax=Brevibacillus fluminis TaxID=511487 RepID=A0A3M8D0F7_9BACL|nr:purine-nucleoside phosphorylase [Brevibacillus fluminis]RNB81554.1 purine-nucleoside phosphorylase [Brevibacillus fluminis]
MSEAIQLAKRAIEERIAKAPTIGLVLGSGLGVLADEISNSVAIPYEEIPHFGRSTVVGHKGQLVIGMLEGKQVVAMQGRFHTYEGHGMDSVVFPIRVLKEIGVEQLIVTNAAGGVNESYMPGDLMVISDHLNMAARNPLIGPNDEKYGVRFPDMSEAYNKLLRALAHATAADLGLSLKEGVYAWMLGPSYETPAEIRMLRMLGADAVGMSTVPEVIVARHMNLDVLGISCITNMAAGILPQPLSHEEVIETTEQVKSAFLSLIHGIVKNM